MIRDYFNQIAKLITVEDVCTPIFNIYDFDDINKNTSQEWFEDAAERGLQPYDQISLVKHGDSIIGYIGVDSLFDFETGDADLMKCISRIDPNGVITANTPLLDAIIVFSKDSPHLYMVLKGHEYIGAFTYSDLYKLPFRLCLFTLLMNIENLLLEILETKPKEAISFLTDNRLEKAKEVYKLRGYQNQQIDGAEESPIQLIECTTFIDKVTIIEKINKTEHIVPSFNKKRCNLAEKLRNSLAHPHKEEELLTILPRNDLIPFIDWARQVIIEMRDYVDGWNAV